MPKINLMVNQLARQVIVLLEQYLHTLGFQAVVHFEIEGCYRSNNGTILDFDMANRELKYAGVQGKLVPEFWQQQWEFVSDFNGQTPLVEAQSADKAIKLIPHLFKKQGITETVISPVVFNGDTRRMIKGSKQFFTHEKRHVHIPNAIQLNVSVNDGDGENIVAKDSFGQRLQQCFINTSQQCALLYLPEPLAYERLLLKEKYGLDDELCSPSDISGGHQGSIALYLEKGKHNQMMGATPLLYDHHQKVILNTVNWRKTARVEHRLGASSRFYNPYINVVYALLNVIDTLNNESTTHTSSGAKQGYCLPQCLYDSEQGLGAVELFAGESWFAHRINKIERYLYQTGVNPQGFEYQTLGDKLKRAYLSQYQRTELIY